MANTGRPTNYTQELADVICELLAMGWSVRRICEHGQEETDVKMPALRTFYKWLRENEDFMHQYARAKEDGVEAEIEDAKDIADDGRNDWMAIYDKQGAIIGWRVNGEAVQRSKLRVDLIKWKASKLKAKKYGDKLDLTSGGEKIKQAPLIISEIKPRNVATETEAEAGS
jgi:hypothetical protein